jgi:ubiquinone biosynthesis protein COQ9
MATEGCCGTGANRSAMNTSCVSDIDAKLVAACFEQVAVHGWRRLSIPRAARDCGIPLDVAQRRVPDRFVLLMRFGAQADAHALKDAAREGECRDRVFDVVMRRIDFLQSHRPGVEALLRALPLDPLCSLLLASLTPRSMAWLLAASGVDSSGTFGRIRIAAMVSIWTWTLIAWRRDSSADLVATMAALDGALRRFEQADGWLCGG